MSVQPPSREPSARLGEAAAALAFLTRIPMPAGLADTRPPGTAAWAFPLAGALVGAVAAAVLAAAMALGLPVPVAATFAVAAAVLLTGALHEDGLADTFDGFGGSTPARRLAIMRDSHIGTYGVAALVVALATRIAAVAAIAFGSLIAAVAALVVAEAASRGVMVVIWHAMPAARDDGLSVTATRPGRAAAIAAGGLATAAVIAAPAAGLGLLPSLFGAVLAAIGTYILWHVTMGAFGGRTGDTLGAHQQTVLCLFLAGLGSG